MVGASVQLYAAGTSGNGSAPGALLSSALTTDANGAFGIAGSVVCPYSNSVLYLVSRGGSAGATGTANAATVLAAVLGTCNSLNGGQSVVADEATTVATAWAMAPFLAAGAQIGATSTNSSGIGLAAATALNLVNPAIGKAPGASFSTTGTAPATRINALANALNTCVVSVGPSSSACTQLFTASTSNSNVPANTLDAAMNIARAPGANVAAIFSLQSGSNTYLPALNAAPSDWSLFATYSGGGMDGPTSVSIDSQGNVWVASYSSAASFFSNTGVPEIPSGIIGNGLLNSYGGAVDVNDTMWVANEQSAGGVNAGLGSITLLKSSGSSPAQYTTGGLNFPIAIAFDSSGVAWVVDYGNSHITLLNADGSALSGTTGYTNVDLQFPSAVATDSKCNAYVANQSSNAITRVLADGSAFTSFVVGQGPASVAVDNADNVWSANFYSNSVGLLSSSGNVLSGTGFTGGGLNAPRGIAADGAGNAWVVSEHGSSIAEFAGASSASPGALLSPSTGLGADAKLLEPYAVAVDAAGNVWVSNYGSDTLTEFIGVATPVKTPLLGPVRVP
jgi:streptogramin lyase